MKCAASESKPFLSRSKGEIPGRARRKEHLSRSNLKQAYQLLQTPNFSCSATEPGLIKEKVSFDYVRDAQSVDCFQELQNLGNSNP